MKGHQLVGRHTAVVAVVAVVVASRRKQENQFFLLKNLVTLSSRDILKALAASMSQILLTIESISLIVIIYMKLETACLNPKKVAH